MKNYLSIVTFLVCSFTLVSQPNQGLEFDGEDDYAHYYLNDPVGVDLHNEYSLEAKVKLYTIEQRQAFLSAVTPSGDYIIFGVTESGQMWFQLNDHEYIAEGDYVFEQEQCTHVAVTVNPETVRFYFNGIFKSQASIQEPVELREIKYFQIGNFGQPYGSTFPLNGVIDETRIWNTFRGDSEIWNNKEDLIQDYGNFEQLTAYCGFEFLARGFLIKDPLILSNFVALPANDDYKPNHIAACEGDGESASPFRIIPGNTTPPPFCSNVAQGGLFMCNGEAELADPSLWTVSSWAGIETSLDPHVGYTDITHWRVGQHSDGFPDMFTRLPSSSGLVSGIPSNWYANYNGDPQDVDTWDSPASGNDVYIGLYAAGFSQGSPTIPNPSGNTSLYEESVEYDLGTTMKSDFQYDFSFWAYTKNEQFTAPPVPQHILIRLKNSTQSWVVNDTFYTLTNRDLISTNGGWEHFNVSFKIPCPYDGLFDEIEVSAIFHFMDDTLKTLAHADRAFTFVDGFELSTSGNEGDFLHQMAIEDDSYTLLPGTYGTNCFEPGYRITDRAYFPSGSISYGSYGSQTSTQLQINQPWTRNGKDDYPSDRHIAVDANGFVYAAFVFKGNLPFPGFSCVPDGQLEVTFNNGAGGAEPLTKSSAIVITKFGQCGASWRKVFPSHGDIALGGMEVTDDGTIFLAGKIEDDLEMGISTIPINTQSARAFVAMLDNTGSLISYQVGNGDVDVSDIKVESDGVGGDIYLLGRSYNGGTNFLNYPFQTGGSALFRVSFDYSTGITPSATTYSINLDGYSHPNSLDFDWNRVVFAVSDSHLNHKLISLYKSNFTLANTTTITGEHSFGDLKMSGGGIYVTGNFRETTGMDITDLSGTTSHNTPYPISPSSNPDIAYIAKFSRDHLVLTDIEQITPVLIDDNGTPTYPPSPDHIIKPRRIVVRDTNVLLVGNAVSMDFAPGFQLSGEGMQSFVCKFNTDLDRSWMNYTTGSPDFPGVRNMDICALPYDLSSYAVIGTYLGTAKVFDKGTLSNPHGTGMFVTNIVDNGSGSSFKKENDDEQKPNKQGFEVYPNPASGVVHVEIPEEGRIFVFDLGGRLVQKFSFPGKGTYEIDLGSYRNGVYMIEGIFGEQKRHIKLIKQ